MRCFFDEHPQALTALAAGQLAAGLHTELRAHLGAACERCEELLADPATDELLTAWAVRLEEALPEPRPGELGAIFSGIADRLPAAGGAASAAADVGAGTGGPRSWLSRWRWVLAGALVPVAMLLLVL